jgi:hypothetical protein
LSWLQSSFSMSTFLRRSSSLFSGGGTAWSSASSAASVAEGAGGAWASAATEAMQKLAASASGNHFPIDVLNFITLPGSRPTYMRSFWRKIVAGGFR